MNFVVLVKSDEGIGIWLSAYHDILAFHSFEDAEDTVNIALSFFSGMRGSEELSLALESVEFRVLQVPETTDWLAEYLVSEERVRYPILALYPLSAGKIKENGLKYWDIAERVPIEAH